MNIATIKVSGVKAVTNDYPTIPAGIVGATVTFEFTDPAWDGLSKTAVFRGCVTRDVLMTGNVVRIPAETVAQACPFLFVGVYGTDAADNLVIPTLWLSLGTVRDAADPSGDPGTDPDLPIWAQLQDRVEALETGAPSDPDSPGTPGRPGEDGEDGGYYTPAVTQPSSDTVEFAFSPSKPDMPAVDPVQVKLPVSQNSGGNVDQSGLSTSAANLLVTILRNGVYSTDQSDNITALAAELGVTEEEPDNPDIPVEPDIPDEPDEPEVTLTGISATYTGGDVAVGTAVTALTGVVVTAHYSDGSTAPVTGYTLSGTIAEGSNTVTVVYDGMTANFTVTGIAESGGDVDENLLYNWDFTKSLTDTVSGTTATLREKCATHTSSGVTTTAAGSSGGAPLLMPCVAYNRTIEVDIANMNKQYTSGHGRLIMFGVEDDDGDGVGFIYRSSGSWQFWRTTWSDDKVVTDPNAFTGKTLVLKIAVDGIVTVYCDGTLVATSTNPIGSDSINLLIGATTNSFYNVTVSAVRVYKGVA